VNLCNRRAAPDWLLVTVIIQTWPVTNDLAKTGAKPTVWPD
jgi:hypothetical protein